MKFDSFWDRINKHNDGFRLETKSRHQEFIFSYDSKYDEVIVIPESTSIPRHITQRDFENVWKKFKEIPGDAYRPAFYQRVTLNASYILAIMEHFLKGAKVE